MAMEQRENERSKKGVVTGKITGTKGAAAAPELAPPMEEPEREHSEPLPSGVGMSSKVESAQRYREMLEEQVQAKKAAGAYARELTRGGTGLQLDSMDAEKAAESKTKSAARDIQEYNHQLAMQKAQDKAAAKVTAHAPAPAYEREEVKAPEAKGMFETPTMLQAERDIQAAKDDKSQKLKEALELQIREDKARKLQDKQERMGYSKKQ